jgi:hypothetical protein
MKLLTASIVIGPLMLFGALPTAAGQSPRELGFGTVVQLAVAGDPAGDRDSYTQKARNDMEDWQRKLHDVGDKAEAKGKEVGNAADSDLNQAWTKAKAASEKLQTMGAEGWDGAKASYEHASHDLSDTWHRIHPDDK